MLKLFSDITRTDLAPAKYAERSFAYLEHSARPQMQRTRDLLEDWFSHYPESHKSDLKRRFETRVESQFLSAFFELYLHELLLQLGCSVELPPQGPLQSRRPDFLVHSQNGPDHYVEAVLADKNSSKDAARQAMVEQVFDAINRIDSPNFFVDISVTGAPSTQPPARKIRARVENWLRSFDPDTVRNQYERGGLAALPLLHEAHEGWKIHFRAFPKSQDVRGKPGIRPIGMWSSGAAPSNAKVAIRNAVRDKANHYRDLGTPYLVGVNSLTSGTDRDEIVEALFGSEEHIFPVNDPDAPPFVNYARDGAWLGIDGPINTRVSAVLVISHLVPWGTAVSDLTLYHNPWASYRYSGEMNRFPKMAVQPDGTLRWEAGIHPRELFGLPEGWPEQDE